MHRRAASQPDPHPALRDLDHLYSLAKRLVGGGRHEAEKLVLEAVRENVGNDGVPRVGELERAIVRAYARGRRGPLDSPDRVDDPSARQELDPNLLDRLPPDVIRAALAGLPAGLRAPLVLEIHSGMDEQASAEVLDLTPAEVSGRIRRGRRELGRRLVDRARTTRDLEDDER